MFRIQVPVLDVFGSTRLVVTRFGGDERWPDSPDRRLAAVIVAGAEHSSKATATRSWKSIAGFLDAVPGGK